MRACEHDVTAPEGTVVHVSWPLPDGGVKRLDVCVECGAVIGVGKEER